MNSAKNLGRNLMMLGTGLGLGIYLPKYQQDLNPHNFIAQAAEKVLPSVVHIVVESEMEQISTSGSGFFIEKDLILTNAHVIGDRDKVKVNTAAGETFAGSLYSIDTISDLAIIQIPAVGENRIVKFGTMESARRGDWVCSIGCPFGLQNTVTAGVISSLARSSSEIGGKDQRMRYVQTDCVVHSGSSGGPLVNMSGQVIGINTQRAEEEGISFAIRIDNALGMIRQLIDHRKIIRPFVGLHTTAINQNVWKQLEKFHKHSIPPVMEGVLITKVLETSPAERAGFMVGDVVTKVDRIPVKATHELLTLVGLHAGAPVEMTIRRSIPLDMDWDGRVNRYEVIEMNLRVVPEELNTDIHNS